MSILNILNQDWFLNTIAFYNEQINWINLYSCTKELRKILSNPEISKVKILIYPYKLNFIKTPMFMGRY